MKKTKGKGRERERERDEKRQGSLDRNPGIWKTL